MKIMSVSARSNKTKLHIIIIQFHCIYKLPGFIFIKQNHNGPSTFIMQINTYETNGKYFSSWVKLISMAINGKNAETGQKLIKKI